MSKAQTGTHAQQDEVRRDEFAFSNKGLLLEALAELLPENALYEFCPLELTNGRCMIVLRGGPHETCDGWPHGPWIDPTRGAASIDVYERKAAVAVPNPGAESDARPPSD